MKPNGVMVISFAYMNEHGESDGSIPRGARHFFFLKGHVIQKTHWVENETATVICA